MILPARIERPAKPIFEGAVIPERVPSIRLARLLRSYLSERSLALAEPLLTPRRLREIDRVLRNRTRTVVTVLERIHDIGNINAVLRSAEALGFFEAHVIQTAQSFKYSKRITHGAHQWMDVRRWPSGKACFDHLKAAGYRVLAATPEAGENLEDIDVTRRTAIVFGNERDGISRYARAACDGFFRIPMLGFTKSFNISVAAAISLREIARRRIEETGTQGDLSREEIRRLRARYVWRSSPLASRVNLPRE